MHVTGQIHFDYINHCSECHRKHTIIQIFSCYSGLSVTNPAHIFRQILRESRVFLFPCESDAPLVRVWYGCEESSSCLQTDKELKSAIKKFSVWSHVYVIQKHACLNKVSSKCDKIAVLWHGLSRKRVFFFYFTMSAKPVNVSQKTNLAPVELHYLY